MEKEKSVFTSFFSTDQKIVSSWKNKFFGIL